MKKTLLSCFLLINMYGFSQSPADVFISDSLTFFGVDFSNCRLIGDFGNGGGTEMKEKMFVQWNEIFLKESGKYDLKKVFRKDYLFYYMTPVAIQNAKTDDNLIRTYKSDYRLDPVLIPKMVEKYDIEELKSGVGLVFIVDRYDKNAVYGYVYVTFFDIATKRVLFSEELKGIPSGGGLRNYWSRALFEILREIEISKYHTWKSKYNPKK